MTETPPVAEFLQSRVDAGAPAAELDFFRSTIQQPDEVALITVFLASERGRQLHGQVFTMTRDGLAALRPVGARTTQTDGPWTLDTLATAAENLTS